MLDRVNQGFIPWIQHGGYNKQRLVTIISKVSKFFKTLRLSSDYRTCLKGQESPSCLLNDLTPFKVELHLVRWLPINFLYHSDKSFLLFLKIYLLASLIFQKRSLKYVKFDHKKLKVCGKLLRYCKNNSMQGRAPVLCLQNPLCPTVLPQTCHYHQLCSFI